MTIASFLPPSHLEVALEWTWGYVEEGVGAHIGVCCSFGPADFLGTCLARGCPKGVLPSSSRHQEHVDGGHKL